MNSLRLVSFSFLIIFNVFANADENSLLNDEEQVVIHYPARFMHIDSDWRTKPLTYQHLDHQNWEAHAQAGEDTWMYLNYFYGKTNGIILESGAYDGTTFSTTLFYEKYLNWTSIHVEASPQNFEKILSSRKSSINIQAALCREQRLLHFVSSDAVGGLIELMEESFFTSWFPDLSKNQTAINELPKVNCFPMKTLLRLLGIKHIDIWVLDIEGAEASALKSTAFGEVSISFIAMECDGHNVEKDNKKMDMLRRRGYTCKVFKAFNGGGIQNCMCKHKDFVPSSMYTEDPIST